jgi:hypothetical protein
MKCGRFYATETNVNKIIIKFLKLRFKYSSMFHFNCRRFHHIFF